MRPYFAFLFVGAVALGSVLAAAQPVIAQVKIDRVRLGLSDRVAEALPEDKDLIVPSGTEVLYIFVDYRGASKTKITTEVTAPGGLTLFEKADTRSGDGTAVVPVSGVQVFQKLAADLVTTAKVTVEHAERAASGASGNLGYLQEAYNRVAELRTATDLVGRMDLGSDLRAVHEDLDASVKTLEILESQRSDVGTSLDKIQAAATDLAAEAKVAQAAADKLKEGAGSITSLPIPDTGSDRISPYDLMIKIGSSPSLSTEFWVTSAALDLPTATPTSRSTGGTAAPTGQATDSSGAAGATRTSGARSSGASGAGQAPAATITPRPTIAGGAAERMTEAAGAQSATGGGRPGAAPAGSTPDTDGDSGDSDEFSQTAEPMSGAADPAAVPTWTVPAAVAMLSGTPGSAEGGAAELDTGSDTASSGPNLAVLGIGVMALIAVAVWLRRRM